MKIKLRIVGWLMLLALSMFNLQLSTAHAQGTAFTYQGRLNDGANPATGIYDLRFAVYNAVSGGSVSGVLTNAATGVTNGLFTVTLDFGSGVFDGNARWLEIAARTNGAASFTTLAPRQPVTPTPYAILAGTAGGLSGTLPVSQVSGVMPLAQLPAAVVTNNQSGVTISGTFNGAGTISNAVNAVMSAMATNALNAIKVFNVKVYGAVGDGTNDDTAAVTNAMQAAYNAGGGTVYFPPVATNQGYQINRQILIPNDGVLYVNHNPPGYTFRQPPIRLTGDGSLFTENSTGTPHTSPNGGSTLFLNATNVLAKIVTLGTGSLEIDHLNLVDKSDGNTDFIYDNNTALSVHDNMFYGQRAYAWGQDCIVLGCTNTTILLASTDSSGCFQGYGTTIHNNFADEIRRFVYLRTAADAVFVVDNSVWDGSGGTACIEILGTTNLSDAGNQIRGNVIESVSYTNSIKATYASFNDFDFNTFWDAGSVHTADYLMSTGANYNLMIGGVGGTPSHLIDNGTGNKFLFPDANNLAASAALAGNSITLNNVASGYPVAVQNVQEGYGLNPIDQWIYSPAYGLYFNQNVAGGNVSWGFGMSNNVAYPNTLWFMQGNIGIGTNAPSQQLEVNGAVQIDGGITATNFTGNGSGLTNLNAANLTGAVPSALLTSVPAANLTGTIPLAQLPAAVMTNNATGVTLGGTFNGNATTATTLGSLTTNTAPPVPSSINVCWGDSLTYGAGAAPGLGYPDDLVSMLNTATITQGWSGYNSTQIKTVFQANPNLWVYPTIIWSGRNNYSDSNAVLADIATMVSDLNSVGNSNYLVMAIINATNETIGTAGYVQITNLNHYLSAIYSNQFFDVRKFLVNAANTNLPFDLFTFTNDTPAAGLHANADAIHLNAAGYLLVAEGVLQSSFLNQDKNVVSEGKIRALIGQALAAPPLIGGIKANGISANSLIITNSMYAGCGNLVIVGDGNLSIFAQNNTIYMRNPWNGVLQSIGSSSFPASAVYANNFYGNAQGLTGLNASQLTGTIPLAQLPSAMVTNNESGVTLGSLNISGITAVSANLVMNDKDIQLRSTYDHGIGWYGAGKPFAGVSVDGPVVYGYSGGGLGIVQTGNVTNLALYWNAAGNVGIGTNAPNQKLVVAGNIYATGTITPNSDRNLKTDFAAVDAAAVLARVARLPIQQWRFKAEPEGVKHFGPMAQDFRAAFGLGEIPTAIATVDADGVALAAIQGLNQKLEQKETEITELKARLERLEQLVTAKNGDGQ